MDIDDGSRRSNNEWRLISRLARFRGGRLVISNIASERQMTREARRVFFNKTPQDYI